jgi:hypothetical protein
LSILGLPLGGLTFGVHSSTPKQQLEVFYQHDLLVPGGWFSDLEAKSALVQHYGTTGWLVGDEITHTYGEENYSSARANVYNHVQPVLLIVDTGENSGMSAVNCIERLREAVFLQRPAHPWLSGSIQTIVCSANAYSKPELAEYAVWDGNWRFIARDKVVELTGDHSLPLWRS